MIKTGFEPKLSSTRSCFLNDSVTTTNFPFLKNVFITSKFPQDKQEPKHAF